MPRLLLSLSIFLALLVSGGALALGSAASSSQAAGPVASWQAKIDPWVLETSAAGETEFLIFLKEQADLRAAATLETKLEKGEYVFQRLTEMAGQTQGPILSILRANGVVHQSYWVANMIWARGDLDLVQALAAHPEVAHLYANPQVQMTFPSPEHPLEQDLAVAGVEWNISHVGAPSVWAEGYTGQGVVIGGQDTGYDWDHPALVSQYRGWNGSSASHDYNWHDAIHSGGGVCRADSPEPCDDHNHGTHTMGTLVGDDGGGNQIGMAPGARWIGCRNMDRGNGTPATYSECYQWFLAPTDLNGQNPDPSRAPDVINNSWSCPPSEGCTDPNVLLTVVQNLRAAGIMTVHSAGNSGSSCGTINTPAAIYAESFTVGATDNMDAIASFSGRGPVLVDGSNRLKPDIVAPGVGIRSSIRGGAYQQLAGTSMAAPHVAGLAALLVSAEPSLAGQVGTLEALIETTALPRTTAQACGGVPGSQVPNNTFGWGRIQALEALGRTVDHQLQIKKQAFPGMPAPGGALTYTLAVTHTHPLSATSGVVITDTLPTGTSLVTATAPFTLAGSTVQWGLGTLGPGQSRAVTLAVQVPVTVPGIISNRFYGARSDQAAPVTGPAVFTLVRSPGIVYLPNILNPP